MSLIRQTVLDVFLDFTGGFEGHAVPHMYVDVIGLVTCAYGNLIDPLSAAVPLPWRNRDGSLAPKDQVEQEWRHLKMLSHDLAHRSLGVQSGFTTVRLDREACEALALAKLAENAAFVTEHHFPAFADFCADAQLGIMSLAWAAGPGFPAKFPRFRAAVLAGDWTTAASEGVLSTTAADRRTPNPGVIPRNSAQRICFANAAAVAAAGGAVDPSRLYWPSFPSPPSSANV